MKSSARTMALFAALMATGCMSLRIGTDAEAPIFELEGPGTAYATISEIPRYKGTIAAAHVFRGG